MFSPVLAANNNHMPRVLPNVYFISSSGREAGSGEGLALFQVVSSRPCKDGGIPHHTSLHGPAWPRPLT